MNDCPGCADPSGPVYYRDCESCAVRMIARGPDFWRSNQDQTMTQRYRDVLISIFGERWREMHEQVKQYAKEQP